MRAVLDAAGVAYSVNPRLVRGLDYYKRTVFEWVTDRSARRTPSCGGGRYDGLIEQLGGKATPAIGFAMGIERVLLMLAGSVVAPRRRRPMSTSSVPARGAAARRCLARAAARRRRHGAVHAGGGNFKAQFRSADPSGARSRWCWATTSSHAAK